MPLRQVADFVETGSPQQIKRLNLQRRIAIYGNAHGRPSGDVGTDAEKIVKTMQLPPGYRFDVGGAPAGNEGNRPPRRWPRWAWR